MLSGFDISDKTIEQVLNIGVSLLILIIGWIIIRLILRIARKTLERSSLDPVQMCIRDRLRWRHIFRIQGSVPASLQIMPDNSFGKVTGRCCSPGLP